jgi:hypothetical protein
VSKNIRRIIIHTVSILLWLGKRTRAEQSVSMDFAIETNLDRILTVLEVLGNLKQVLAMKHRNHSVQSSKPTHEG